MITSDLSGMGDLGFLDFLTDMLSPVVSSAAGTIYEATRPVAAPMPAATTGIAAAATPIISTTAARNPSGPAFAARQRQLKALGFDPGPIDGFDGPSSQRAIKAFQSSVALAVDGIIGPQTGAALDRAVAALGGGPAASATPAAPVASAAPLAPLPPPSKPTVATSAAPPWMLYGAGALAVGGAAYLLTKKRRGGARKARR